MAEGQVSIRFSVQDGEVVRQALENLGKDGQAALAKLDAAGKQPSAGLSALDKIVSALRERTVGLALSIGPAGQVLFAMGPAGIAAAAGIGATIAVLEKLKAAANELAEKSLGVRNFAETVGLSTDQVQALVAAGARLGRSPEQVQTFVEKFTSGMQQLRHGTGELLDQITRIDPVLAHQLAGAKTTAEAWDLVAAAYLRADRAGDIFTRNAITRAIGGNRGGLGAGGLLGASAGAGGLQNLANDAAAAGAVIDKELIQKLAKLSAEIKQTNEDTSKIFASTFSEHVLENSKQVANSWLIIAKAAREFSLSPSLEEFIKFFNTVLSARDIGGDSADIEKIIASLNTDIAALTKRKGQISASIISEKDPAVIRSLTSELAKVNEQLTEFQRQRDFVQKQGPLKVTISKPSAANDVGGEEPRARSSGPSAEFLLNRPGGLRDEIALLGAAATPAEQFKLKILELVAAQEKHTASAATAARALGASVLAQEQASAAARERLGLITREELLSLNASQIDDAAAKGYVKNAQERASAEALVVKQIKETIEQQQIRNAQLPGLKQLEIAWGDLNKQFDQAATQGIGQLNSGLADMTLNSNLTTAGFQNLEKQLARTAVQMALNMTVGKLLSTVLQGIFGFINPGGLGLPLGKGLGTSPTGAAGGGSFDAGEWITVGENGPERVRFGSRVNVIPSNPIPTIVSPSIASGAAGPVNVSLKFEDHAGVQAEQTGQTRSGNDIQLEFTLTKMIKRGIAKGDFDSEMGARFGARRPTQAIG